MITLSHPVHHISMSPASTSSPTSSKARESTSCLVCSAVHVPSPSLPWACSCVPGGAVCPKRMPNTLVPCGMANGCRSCTPWRCEETDVRLPGGRSGTCRSASCSRGSTSCCPRPYSGTSFVFRRTRARQPGVWDVHGLASPPKRTCFSWTCALHTGQGHACGRCCIHRYRHGQQYRCPHGVITGWWATSKQMLHSNPRSNADAACDNASSRVEEDADGRSDEMGMDAIVGLSLPFPKGKATRNRPETQPLLNPRGKGKERKDTLPFVWVCGCSCGIDHPTVPSHTSEGR
eukprot:scaffold2318_cov363-Pavlova_lutheri.AAC.15